MFDLCDDTTRAVIDAAVEEARSLGHHWLGTEHVLIALTLHREHLPPAIEQLLPTAGEVRQALNTVTDPGPAPRDVERAQHARHRPRRGPCFGTRHVRRRRSRSPRPAAGPSTLATLATLAPTKPWRCFAPRRNPGRRTPPQASLGTRSTGRRSRRRSAHRARHPPPERPRSRRRPRQPPPRRSRGQAQRPPSRHALGNFAANRPGWEAGIVVAGHDPPAFYALPRTGAARLRRTRCIQGRP